MAKRYLTIEEFRLDMDRVLKEALDSGEMVELEQDGRKLLIMPLEERKLDLAQLPKRRGLNCTPEELVATTWDDAWQPDDLV